MSKVIFITNTGRLVRPYFDPSVRYRCFNLAEELSVHGNYCKVTTSTFFINNEIDDFDVYVFHRPPFSPILIDKVQKLQAQGKVVIADYDDLTFDIKNAQNSSLFKSGRVTQREVLSIFSRNAAALSVFNNFTVSTQALHERLKELSPDSNVAVVHNALTNKYKSICDQIRLNEPLARVKGRVGYFSGTKSHDKDIEYISSALELSCNKESGREILFVGPVDIPENVRNHCNTITNDLVGYHEMIKLLSTCEVVIAPLELTFFNSCKSGLKYFESAYAGCNVVASPIPDIDRFQSDNLFKAVTIEEWGESLDKALSNYSQQCPIARLKDASAQADINNEVKSWSNFINEIQG
ncbi:hypothetical protein PSEHALCIP103_02538 [Pseudoalteromonas haloplanktis]|uniref:Glycosyltransferase n=1 Tax=Pseudoalteromonas haloplanktis TaxID=228 RepID=A0A9W4R0H5_PSEHA|nr:glycosyltransferase [Pseudoalteromonas haloplanktis]CAH9061649.1 hypothetical protein PSEHALCIP103_02538 [Pseudoalteromonas haloplanktis]